MPSVDRGTPDAAGDALIDPGRIDEPIAHHPDAVGEPFSIEGQYIQIGASTGIALYPTHGSEPTTLLQHADSEMYRVKRESSEIGAGARAARHPS